MRISNLILGMVRGLVPKATLIQDRVGEVNQDYRYKRVIDLQEVYESSVRNAFYEDNALMKFEEKTTRGGVINIAA